MVILAELVQGKIGIIALLQNLNLKNLNLITNGAIFRKFRDSKCFSILS